MAHRLGLVVIPEGIETADQLVRLREMGCRIGQGFLLSHPLSSYAVEELLYAPTPLPDVHFYETTAQDDDHPSAWAGPTVASKTDRSE